MMFSSQPDNFSPSQLNDSTTTPSKAGSLQSPRVTPFQGSSHFRPFVLDLQMRGLASTMPLTVKQIADAHQSGTGEKGAPFIIDGVETANVRPAMLHPLLPVSPCV
jgi:hypothetical protein